MNLHPIIRRLTVCFFAACLCLGMGTSLLSCSQGGENDTVAPTEPVTLPDLADNRILTDPADYQERFDTAFSQNQPVAATDLTYTVADDGVTVTGYTGGDVVVVLPDTVEEKPVVAIAEKAFAGKGTLKALSIPDSVVMIGAGALEGCASLSTLRTPVYTCDGAPFFGALFGAGTYEINASRVPATLSTLLLTGGETIPAYAFYDCSFEAVSLPATVTEIGDFAFYGCEKLAYIPLAHTALTEVGDRAFTNCAALLSLDLPTTVETLGYAMLEGCGKLESLTLPFVGQARLTAEDAKPAAGEDGADTEAETDVNGQELLSPADSAYLGYLFGARSYTFTAGYLPASLIRVTLHEGCGDIPANAFFECSSIREIRLPAGVTIIGRRAFYGCEKLAAITIPDSVTTLGDDAFHGCIRLVDLTVGAGVTTLGIQVFMDCLSLGTVTLPTGVTHLPNATFAGCISLETLIAPGVTTCGSQVFRACDKLQGWSEVVPTVD